MGHVLSQLTDLIKMISSHLKMLRNGGELIFCLFNIQRWTVLKRLLQGDWGFQKNEINNNLPIQFFTRESAYQLFEYLGLTLEKQVRLSLETSVFKGRRDEVDETCENTSFN